MPISPRSLAAVAVAGATVLVGCQTATTAPPAQPPTAASTTHAAAATPAPTSVPARLARCTLDQLKASLGATTGEAGQRHTTVVWTNTSAAGCLMEGFGGVDLQGPDDPMGPTYSLPRTSATPESFTLAPGHAAHTTITWLPPQDGPGWTPTTIVVTPPDETRSARLDWPGGAVLRQDGATHPGSYVGPVSPGAGG
jgi:hypothetical protein